MMRCSWGSGIPATAHRVPNVRRRSCMHNGGIPARFAAVCRVLHNRRRTLRPEMIARLGLHRRGLEVQRLDHFRQERHLACLASLGSFAAHFQEPLVLDDVLGSQPEEFAFTQSGSKRHDEQPLVAGVQDRHEHGLLVQTQDASASSYAAA